MFVPPKDQKWFKTSPFQKFNQNVAKTALVTLAFLKACNNAFVFFFFLLNLEK